MKQTFTPCTVNCICQLCCDVVFVILYKSSHPSVGTSARRLRFSSRQWLFNHLQAKLRLRIKVWNISSRARMKSCSNSIQKFQKFKIMSMVRFTLSYSAIKYSHVNRLLFTSITMHESNSGFYPCFCICIHLTNSWCFIFTETCS